MKRRLVVLVVACVLGIGLVVGMRKHLDSTGLTDLRAAGINASNFNRIQLGMSADEVDGIFGVPPGDYRRSPGFLLVGPGHILGSEAAGGGRLEVWYVPRYHAEVLFDRNGCVVGKYWHDADANQ
jgi:hypothetical protein